MFLPISFALSCRSISDACSASVVGFKITSHWGFFSHVFLLCVCVCVCVCVCIYIYIYICVCVCVCVCVYRASGFKYQNVFAFGRCPVRIASRLLCTVLRTFLENYGIVMTEILDFVSILSFRRVLYVVCFLLGISPASEVKMPTFRNPLSVPKRRHLNLRRRGNTQKKTYYILDFVYRSKMKNTKRFGAWFCSLLQVERGNGENIQAGSLKKLVWVYGHTQKKF